MNILSSKPDPPSPNKDKNYEHVITFLSPRKKEKYLMTNKMIRPNS
jgi:hypothetical protein